MSVRPADSPLRRLVRRHRGRLFLTYVLLAVEAAVDLVHPLALGWAVQAFLTGEGAGLALFVLQQAVACSLGVTRRLWDARFFNRLAAELAEGLVLDQRAAGVEVSAVAARAALSNQLVDFLERDVPFVFRCAVQCAGAVVMLGLVAPRVLPLALGLAAPAAVCSAVYARAARRGTARLHDELERTVTVVGGGNPDQVGAHFGALAAVRRFLVRAETAHFGAWQVIGLAFLAAVFVRDPGPGRTAGEWTAMLGYAQLLLTALVNLPRLIDQLTRLRDISHRLGTPAPAGSPCEEHAVPSHGG